MAAFFFNLCTYMITGKVCVCVCFTEVSVLQITFLSLNPKFSPALQYPSFYFSVSLVCLFYFLHLLWTHSCCFFTAFFLLIEECSPTFSALHSGREGGEGMVPCKPVQLHLRELRTCTLHKWSSHTCACPLFAWVGMPVCSPATSASKFQKAQAGSATWPEVGDPCNRMKVYYWAWKYWFCIGACAYLFNVLLHSGIPQTPKQLILKQQHCNNNII